MMEITELLKKHNLGDVDAIDKEGNTPLHLAIRNKTLSHEEIIEILKVLLDKNIDVNVENKSKQTALHLAVTNRMKDVVEFLIERKASFDKVPHFFIEDEYEKFSRLSPEIKYSYKNIYVKDSEKHKTEFESINFVEWLISKGFDFDCKNEKNQSALYLAIDHNLQHVLPLLLKSTRDIDAVDEKNNTLFRIFLERSAHYCNRYVINTSWYSDRYAADIVKILLDRGSSASQVNAKDKTGASPLHGASKFRTSVVGTLIEHGADVHSRNNQKDTPLHSLMTNSENPFIMEITELLLEHGANVNAKNSQGLTPLHEISKQRRSRYSRGTVKTLLKHGGDINLLSAKGWSVLDLARHGDRLEYQRACRECIRQHNMRQPEYYDEFGRPTFDNAMSMEDCPCPVEESATDVLKTLTDYSIVLKAVRLPWDEKHENLIRTCYEATIEIDEYEWTYEHCLDEVEMLKKEFVDTRVSVYDFLRKGPSGKCAYVNNEKLQQLIISPELKDQFPYYFILIWAGYREAVTRKSLLEPAKEAWLQLTGIALPDICVERILAYLSNADLFDMTERD